MVAFRAACDGKSLQNWQTAGNDRIAFARGNAGFVAINSNGSAWGAQLWTGLPDGTYCDVISGGKVNGRCTGASVVVKGGVANLNIPGRQAIAFYSLSRL